MNKAIDLIPNLNDDDRRIYAHAVDRARKAENGEGLTSAGFFDPHQRAELSVIIKNCIFDGGTEDAERTVAVFVPQYYEHMTIQELRELREYPIVPMKIGVSKHLGKPLTHRDYLGTLMGMGIRRDTIGDIYTEDFGCTLTCLRIVAETIIANLEKVSNVGAKAEICDFSCLIPPNPQVKEIKTTLASLRLDSAAAESFSISRTDAQDAIRQGFVTLNWAQCRYAAEPIHAGDKIAFKGHGRARVIECDKITKKGNIFTLIHRYI